MSNKILKMSGEKTGLTSMSDAECYHFMEMVFKNHNRMREYAAKLEFGQPYVTLPKISKNCIETDIFIDTLPHLTGRLY